MAEIQQGGFAVVFGLPSTDANSVKTGTTSTPAAIAFKIVSASFRMQAQNETTEDADGVTIHVSTFNQTDEVTLSGYFSGTTRGNAVTANVLPVPGMHLILTGASGGAKNDADAIPTAGKAYRVTGASKAFSTSNKQMVEITAVKDAGITSYTQL